MPDLDYKAMSFWLSFANSLGLMAMFAYATMTNRQKINTKAISELQGLVRTEVNELDDRVIRMEKTIEHLPTHTDVAQINRRVDDCAQELRKLEGTTTQINASVQMIHQHLLNS